MSDRVYAFFNRRELTKRAIENLVQADCRREDIEIMASEPYDDVTVSHRQTTIPLCAILGGLIGGVSGGLLASLTAKSMMLPTGGMPIVAYAPVGIITFALAGLGAIAGTLISTLFEAQLFKLGKFPYEDELASALARGNYIIGVRCRAENQFQRVEGILVNSGSDKVIRYVAD